MLFGRALRSIGYVSYLAEPGPWCDEAFSDRLWDAVDFGEIVMNSARRLFLGSLICSGRANIMPTNRKVATRKTRV